MSHYICKGGCKGVSETPGVCQTEDCPSKGHDLEECVCEDGQHGVDSEENMNENESGEMMS